MSTRAVGRPRTHEPTPEQTVAALDAYASGASIKAVGCLLGCPGDTARRILVEAGATIRGQGRTGARCIPAAARLRQAVAAYHRGESLTEIGQRLGCHSSTARRVLVQAGVTIRNRGGSRPTPRGTL